MDIVVALNKLVQSLREIMTAEGFVSFHQFRNILLSDGILLNEKLDQVHPRSQQIQPFNGYSNAKARLAANLTCSLSLTRPLRSLRAPSAQEKEASCKKSLTFDSGSMSGCHNN